ncbi:hypothetical protein EDB19DRAFT_1216323 [Suillus lakei]|nr:hypothetical protein EDB19DRAFT_1216323 [Suillus lakei]
MPLGPSATSGAVQSWFASWKARSKNPSEKRCDGLFSARACYILHGMLVMIHILLLIFLVRHWEHHVTLPFTAKNDGLWPAVLSASLQAFYTIYTAILLFLTQRLAISRTLARRQKLTAIHDISGAWAGLGSALSSVWRQTVIPASWWMTLAVTTYLAGISVLHVTSSTLLQFQTFNTSMATSVPTTLGWLDDSSYYSSANWGSITASLPVVSQLTGLVSAGLSNTTIYDTPKTASIVGNATVNATSITSRCGLLPNVTYIATNNTVNVPLIVDGVHDSIMLSANIPWPDQIYVLPWVGGDIPYDDYNLAMDNVFLMVSTLLEIQPSIQNEVAVNMTVGYNPSGGESVPYVIHVYFMQCSLSANTTDGVIDIPTNILLSPMPVSQSTQWDMVQWMNQNYTWKQEISFALSTSASSQIPFYTSSKPIMPSIADGYIMSLVGLNLTDQYERYLDDAPPIANFTLGPDKLELAVAKVAAQLIWTAGRMGTANGGLQPGNGIANVNEELIALRLNINLLPLSFAASASVIMLGLALHMTRAFDTSRNSQAAIPNIGVLQLLWLGHRSASINEVLEDVEHPTEDNLRRAGMIDVCLTKTTSDEEELGSSTHSLPDEVNHDHDDET